MEEYLGHNINYWIELQRKAAHLDVVDWLQEIGNLRAKVSFYESRIKQLHDFKEKNKEII
jgi:hypothetical protein